MIASTQDNTCIVVDFGYGTLCCGLMAIGDETFDSGLMIKGTPDGLSGPVGGDVPDDIKAALINHPGVLLHFKDSKAVYSLISTLREIAHSLEAANGAALVKGY
jgi:hypothetical protein